MKKPTAAGVRRMAAGIDVLSRSIRCIRTDDDESAELAAHASSRLHKHFARLLTMAEALAEQETPPTESEAE